MKIVVEFSPRRSSFTNRRRCRRRRRRLVADSSRRRRRRPSVRRGAALRFYIIRENSRVRRKHIHTRVVMENVCRTKRNEKRKRDLLLRTFFY